MTVELRDATVDDLSGIMEIYNDAVVNTTAIWNEVLVDLENRKEWFAARKARGFPVIVAILDGKVAGYASYGDWRAFDGYRHTVENSVYVRADRRGCGIGRDLLAELIVRARAVGKHAMVAAIEAGNAGSIRLHERLGFETTGTLPQVGVKFGTWLDLTFMHLILDDRTAIEADGHAEG